MKCPYCGAELVEMQNMQGTPSEYWCPKCRRRFKSNEIASAPVTQSEGNRKVP